MRTPQPSQVLMDVGGCVATLEPDREGASGGTSTASTLPIPDMQTAKPRPKFLSFSSGVIAIGFIVLLLIIVGLICLAVFLGHSHQASMAVPSFQAYLVVYGKQEAACMY